MRKQAEFKTTDFSHENIHKLITEKFGELFMNLEDIGHAIERGHIGIFKNKFVVRM